MEYDLLLVGGGMVGASLALALSGQGLRIGLLESRPLQGAADDERAIALAYGSRRIFEGLGVWSALAPQAQPIERIHISERGGWASAELEARQRGIAALGYVAQARHIQACLAERLTQCTDVELVCPATVQQLALQPEQASVQIEQQGVSRHLSARLVVAADGARSSIRQQLGIPTLEWDYQQMAVIATLTPNQPHRNVAYERFTEQGPLALLPLDAQRFAVVLTVAREQAESILALSDAQFIQLVIQRFGPRLGGFHACSQRQAWPLVLLKAEQITRPRLALVGNAAHTLHPIAGQGLNLGLRDVAVLADVLVQAQAQQQDIGSAAVLQRFAAGRVWDQRATIGFTDALTRVFSWPLAPARLARQLGLFGFDNCPPLKDWFADQAMGLGGRLPRLSQGLSLR